MTTVDQLSTKQATTLVHVHAVVRVPVTVHGDYTHAEAIDEAIKLADLDNCLTKGNTEYADEVVNAMVSIPGSADEDNYVSYGKHPLTGAWTSCTDLISIDHQANKAMNERTRLLSALVGMMTYTAKDVENNGPHWQPSDIPEFKAADDLLKEIGHSYAFDLTPAAQNN